MPITRRKRANPPEQQPETTNNTVAEQVEQQPAASETPAVEQSPTEAQAVEAKTQSQAQAPEAQQPAPAREEKQPTSSYQSFTPPSSAASVSNGERAENNGEQVQQPQNRAERMGRMERAERHEYTSPIESGRRTSRGELFRRPPQPPSPQAVPTPITQSQLQAPSHEISLPLGNLLHLAYNPGYTGSDEARSALLQQLASESKAGGRARCWSCGSLAIVYDRWNTRSKTFGEVGVAFCEICGVWSVM